MKIFAVYTNIELVNKAGWLDEYRKKYDQLYDLHVTLKQPCYIEEAQLPDVKNKLSALFSELKVENHKIHLVFGKMVSDNSDPVDGVIMIEAQNPDISKLQKSIVTALSDYKQYYEPASKEWEENFKPHITIAHKLDSENFQLAQKDVPKDYVCEGVIKEVLLAIIDPEYADDVKTEKEVVTYKL